MGFKPTNIPLIMILFLSACQIAPSTTFGTPAPTETGGAGCNWERAFPTEEATVVWPVLLPVEAEFAYPGDEIEVVATGGYLRWNNACGESINESAREFQLFIDGEMIGNISCYVNVCRVRITIPIDTPPGMHSLSVEGGSSLDLEIVGR